jgi:hypothetical protein
MIPVLWIALSLFFVGLIYRELTNPALEFADFELFDWGYLVVLFVIAAFFAWRPIRYWRFETRLENYASILADQRPVTVHCNTGFDAIFDNEVNVAGHADPRTGAIVLQYPWCAHLMDYLADPGRASAEGIWSMSVFVHESMHIRGELNEAKTECQGMQRRLRAEKMFGVPEPIARKNTRHFIQQMYPTHAYFSPECRPGRSLDERLEDSSWRIR